MGKIPQYLIRAVITLATAYTLFAADPADEKAISKFLYSNGKYYEEVRAGRKISIYRRAFEGRIVERDSVINVPSNMMLMKSEGSTKLTIATSIKDRTGKIRQVQIQDYAEDANYNYDGKINHAYFVFGDGSSEDIDLKKDGYMREVLQTNFDRITRKLAQTIPER